MKSPVEHLIDRLGPGELVPRPAPSPRGAVPASLRALWEHLGLRTWLDGFLWLTDPADFAGVLEAWGQDAENGLVFARTGLGDLALWQDEEVFLVNVRNGVVAPTHDDSVKALAFQFGDALFRDRLLAHAVYREARTRVAAPAYDEVFAFAPHPRLGGDGTAASLSLVKLIPHLELLGRL